jgi:hypothetical protein
VSLVVGGCFSLCSDGSPRFLAIEHVDRRGFRGRWNDPEWGIVRSVDRKGRFLPPPEGFFCAERVE